MGRKKEIYRDVRFFHRALQLCLLLVWQDLDFKGRVERIFFFASFKLPLFNEYEMVFIIA